jgi:hypothetical protein
MAAGKSVSSIEKSLPLPLAGGAHRAAPVGPGPHQNHLLGALPADDFKRIASDLELMAMKLGDVLYESGDQLRYVYFPITCIISLLYVMEDGASFNSSTIVANLFFELSTSVRDAFKSACKARNASALIAV